ncbi:lipocalin-like domain-containing protein [soil metagenome]
MTTRRFLSLSFAFVVAIASTQCADGNDAPVQAALDLGELLGGADTLHERVVDPRVFAFPDDHGPHPTFRTEWWYFTGNLTTDEGEEFGYQLTFFRSALTDSASFTLLPAIAPDTASTAGTANAADTTNPADTAGTTGTAGLAGSASDARSDWRSRHAYMAHFAVSDIGASRIHTAQRFARAALGLAGADARPFRVWLHDWQAARTTGNAAYDEGDDDNGMFPLRLVAVDGDVAIDLLLERGKPMVLQGERGLSRKGAEPGNASYYYSYMRMPATGTIRVNGRSHRVHGESWLDREWSTSALSDDLQGWDWMALQFADTTELMLYRLRRHDGSMSPFSTGTYVQRDGSTVTLHASDFTMTPTRTWRSPVDATSYPVSWHVEVPAVRLSVTVDAAFDAQELNLAVRYWEGSVRIDGMRADSVVTGRGYLEMTGYDVTSASVAPR